jgi:hypothetical protein
MGYEHTGKHENGRNRLRRLVISNELFLRILQYYISISFTYNWPIENVKKSIDFYLESRWRFFRLLK